MTKLVTTAMRCAITGFLVVKVYGETGPWTAAFLVWICLCSEIVMALAKHVVVPKLSSTDALLRRVEGVVAAAERTSLEGQRAARAASSRIIAGGRI